MDELSTSIQVKMLGYMKLVEKELLINNKCKYQHAKILSGSWKNQRIITAYVSIFPTGNSTEESIDASIQLTITETNAIFHSDIAKSTGVLIVDIENEVISFETGEELLAKVEKLSERISEKLTRILEEL